MQITDRDIEIIRFINEFGFCEMPQIERRFSIKKPRSYRIIKRLIKAGLVNHKRVFYARYGIYYVTSKGADCTDLPAMDKISVGYYEHQMILTNVYIKLRQQYPDTYWISERRLKHEKFYEGVGKAGHVSDGILVFPDGKEVAVEVELSIKGKKRIERIFKSYAAQFSIKEVWYYCPHGMVNALSVLSAKIPFIKINNLAEFLL